MCYNLFMKDNNSCGDNGSNGSISSLAAKATGEKVCDVNSLNSSDLSYSAILSEICQEEKIDLSSVSAGWVRILERGGQRRFIVGYKFGLNSAAAVLVADDKFATFEVLTAAEIPVIKHHILYEETNQARFTLGKSGSEYVARFLEKYGEIVIKPNNGTKGDGVMRARSLNEAMAALPTVFHQSYSASICPFYMVRREYRVIMLDGQARLTYAKERGEDWRFNLEQGARAELVKEAGILAKLSEMAEQVTQAMGLRFCSVDIIETEAGEWLVMEVNSGVMIRKFLRQHPDQRKLVKEIYRGAIRKMFE